VIVEGKKGGRNIRYVWDLLDFYDTESQATSMSRTTAFPCTIIAKMIAHGEITKKGVLPPELIGSEDGVLEKVLAELQRRGVRFHARQS
jgi:lysine 6-dehydrogenase